MIFDLLDCEQLYPEVHRRWMENPHDVALFDQVGRLIDTYNSLWFTNYGSLYEEMCRYHGRPIPQRPRRVSNSKYVVVIYKRYEN